MPSFNEIHECFKFNGLHYNLKTLKIFALHLLKDEKPYNKTIGEFLLQWLDISEAITLKTSGSTGKPKTIEIRKQSMVNSAIATGDFFNLKPRDKALLCLPAHYIAGKMMLVRAMVLGLEIDSIEPKSNLEIDLKKHYHFTAMVPMQLEINLNRLINIKTLIVGGTKVISALKLKLQEIETSVFETYGMTETVSHIAVKQLNNNSKCLSGQSEASYFKTLPNIEIFQDNRQCLIVNAPFISEEKIITNDVVAIHSKNEFEWLGRADNIINSGGIKIFPEQIENKLSDKIKNRFFIASEANEVLGEQVILILEGEEIEIKDSLFKDLKNYTKPKKTYFLSQFIETASGKIQRAKTLQLLKK